MIEQTIEFNDYYHSQNSFIDIWDTNELLYHEKVPSIFDDQNQLLLSMSLLVFVYLNKTQ